MFRTWSLTARILAISALFSIILAQLFVVAPAQAQDDTVSDDTVSNDTATDDSDTDNSDTDDTDNSETDTVSAEVVSATVGAECVDDRLFFENDDDAPRIRADLPDFFEQTLTLPFAEPPGRYEVLVSTFEIFSREGQEREQLVVIVNGETFGPTPDLPGEVDGVLVEQDDISLGFVDLDAPVDTVIVRHAFAGEEGIGAESIRLRDVTLVCAPVEPAPETTTTTEVTTTTTELTTTTVAPAGETTPTTEVAPTTQVTPTTSVTPSTLEVTIGQQNNPATTSTRPAATNPTTTRVVVSNQTPTLPRTGSGAGVLSVLSLLMLVLGSATMFASRRFAPVENKLSKAYLASIEKIFGSND